ncbi:hypothetical protein DKX38_029788 [Salix brachista]|uniref:NAC domain-containing protein n=1 Tax=Salix brachista TaxID=2182728 RepID=A0A5N5J3K2_9ROSI|nr:hypothetical protein DKX38_029788 [Salix brachista]
MTRMATPFDFNVGQRFSPTGVELINHFLKQKLLGNDQLVSRIPLLDLYQFDPWNLPYMAATDSDDGEGYFFSPLHPKYPGSNNGRISRSTSTGSWQAKGKDYEIKSEFSGEVIGIRRIFVHSCEKDGIKYVMHEYSIPNQSSLVLCKVMKKMPSKKSEGPCKKVKKRKEAADKSILSYGVTKKNSEGPCKKVKKTDEKADMPYNKENITPEPDEGFENWITSDKSDLSTYNNIIISKDQQAEKSTSDNGGKDRQKTSSASVYLDACFTTLEDQVNPEIQPHLQFPGYDQQDYSLYDFTQVDPPLMLTEQANTYNGPAGTSMSVPKEDHSIWLEPLWS